MRLLITLFFLFFVCATASATIYRYVDEAGRLHFTDVPTEAVYSFYRATGQGQRIGRLIDHYADRFRLDAALIKAIIKVESDFDPKVVSSKGAQGLMQLMPATAKEVGVSDPFDPGQSIYGGSSYLRRMMDTFNSNLDYALAAYNAGPSAVQRYDGVPPYSETRSYIQKVKKYMDFYRRYESSAN